MLKPSNHDIVIADVNMLHCEQIEDVDTIDDRAGVKRSAVTWIQSVMPPVSQMTLCLEKWRSELGVDFDKLHIFLKVFSMGF